MRYFTFTFLFFTYSILSAQTDPSIQWQKALGGNDNESAFSIQATADGGYIMVGISNYVDGDVTENHGNNDCWVVKLDPNGNIQWQKSLGGSGNDQGQSVHPTSDGGYIIAASSVSSDGDVAGNHGQGDYWIIKLDSNGNMEWQKSLGGSGNDIPRSIQPTSDSGYIVAGSSTSTDGDVIGNHGNSDYWIVKLDAGGNIQWQKSLGGSDGDAASSIQQTYDGGYIIGGTSSSTDGDVIGNHGGVDYWIVRLSYDGSLLWQKSLGGSGNDYCYFIRETYESGYIVAGASPSIGESPIPNYDYRIIKLSNNGAVQWDKYFGGSGYDVAQTVRQATNWDFIISGSSTSTNGNVTGNHGSQDYWILRLDYLGNLKWQKSLGGPGADTSTSMIIAEDYSCVIAGATNSTTGDVTDNHGLMDAWIVKLAPEQLSVSESQQKNKTNLYPNPAKDFFYLDHLPKESTISITDMAGRKLFSQKYHEEKVRIDTSGFTNGIYIVQVKNKEEIIVSEKISVSK
ncbi:T9SS type A sorting domain-containing protein [Chryseobacterium lactis]|uniref:T9SS type A sorting domain-containing protein n=1 Tax=Chryseobacterium lactis TaxID=1241981 RepID=UPI001623AE15|nr:T9SS type A sorting domain-containing protein [Chryseobacterium lactis]